MISRFAQVRKYLSVPSFFWRSVSLALRGHEFRDWRASVGDRDTLGVARPVDDHPMTIQLDCPWCQNEVAFEVDETADELVCTACRIRTEFAPDSVATYTLLYEAA
jgi:hypothetical protein